MHLIRVFEFLFDVVIALAPATCLLQNVPAQTLPSGADRSQQDSATAYLLDREFDFGAPRAMEPQQFEMETEVKKIGPDGTPMGTDVYRVTILAEPLELPGDARGRSEIDHVRFTCKKFTIQRGALPPFEIPSLADWSFEYSAEAEGIDEEGRVFGIDHEIFDSLEVGGVPLGPEMSYLVYNTFIDFTGFCQTFARPALDGAGIQDLRRVGDKIVHSATNTEPPVNLGDAVAEGSYFRNGEVTLELLGVGSVEGLPCALVRFDSGGANFKMIVTPMPNMSVPTTGSSHYWGDIYIDLDSRWVQRINMTELVVSQTKLPTPPGGSLNSVIERRLELRNTTKQTRE